MWFDEAVDECAGGGRRMMAERLACPVCGSQSVAQLTVPNKTRSMFSDGRVSDAPLDKCSCKSCGHGFLTTTLGSTRLGEVYDDDYNLGLRTPDADRQRAAGYCEEISQVLARFGFNAGRGISVVEFGSGTGALLAEISSRWPIIYGLGIEPARKLVEVALGQLPEQIEIRQGFVDANTRLGQTYDLCISVNVIEHTPDPVEFLSACRTVTNADSLIAIICPDGEAPYSELLFADHISSFSVQSFALIASKAGLSVAHTASLTAARLGFRIFVLRHGRAEVEPRGAEHYKLLSEERDQYLLGWSELENEAIAALDKLPFGIFGVGEYADLLASYCPYLVQQALFYVVDNPQFQFHRGLPVVSTERFLSDEARIGIAAVNPRSWSQIKQRLRTSRLIHPYEFTRLRTKLK